MKKAILTLTICLLAAFGATAQESDGGIRIDRVTVTETGDSVTVTFTVTIEPKAVGRNHTRVLSPVLTGGGHSLSMPAIVVKGKGTKALDERYAWVSGTTPLYEKAVLTENGRTVEYTATVTAQEWMDGATLKIETVLGGCCSYDRLIDRTLAENIDLNRVIPEPKIILVEQPWVPVTVADSLSLAFPFVVPASEYDEEEPFKIYDDERDNALVVYYPVARHVIEPEYMDNRRTLRNLITALNMILASTDSKVKFIVVAGFASPEGNFERNNRLAFERAVSVKQYLMTNCGMTDGQIKLYNGSEDWRGLRAMVVKSNLPEKQQVVDIIDNTPLWDSRTRKGRLAELQRLNGGRTYQYLLNEYFPYLRNGAFIRVYYENN